MPRSWKELREYLSTLRGDAMPLLKAFVWTCLIAFLAYFARLGWHVYLELEAQPHVLWW